MIKGLHSSDLGTKNASIEIFEGKATWEHFIDIAMASLKTKISKILVFLIFFFILFEI